MHSDAHMSYVTCHKFNNSVHSRNKDIMRTVFHSISSYIDGKSELSDVFS